MDKKITKSPRRAEAIIEVQNGQLNEVLDMLPAYLVLLSPDYHVPFANRFFRERFGESHGKRCFEYLFNRTEPCEVCETYKVLKTNAPLEWEWTGPDGHNYYIYDFPFNDRDGTKLIMEVGIDITEQKQAQKELTKARDELEIRVQERTRELKESEENSRRIIETANEGIWTSDPDGKTTFVNQKMADMLGYTREEIIGRLGAEFLLEGQQSLAVKTREELKAGTEIQREFQFRRKDGMLLWTLAAGTALLNENGQYVGNLYMHTDITERKKAEEAIKLDEARLESLLRITQHEGDNVQDWLDNALDEAINLTGSKIGYIYLYNEDRQEFILNTWSKGVMKECTITEPQTVYQLEKTGIWGEVVRQRRPIMLNDFTVPNPLRKGYPHGHAPLHRFLSIPVIEDGHILAVVGVANKATDYDESDTRQLQLLMDAVWKYINKQEAARSTSRNQRLPGELNQLCQCSYYRVEP